MSVQGPEIIAYAYEFAPNPQKLIAFLGFFGVPYKYVEIPPIMPRPQLSAIGITHRRTPLLSINSDMYIDNALIISRLSDIAQHYDSGLEDSTNHVEYDGLGQQAFGLAVGLLPMDHPMVQSKGFIEDRSDLIGRKFDIQGMADARPYALSQMLCFLELIQGHFLKGDRKFFLGGTQPTTADLYVYGSLNWGLRYHGGAQPDITSKSYPKIFEWLDAIQKFIDSRRKETKSSMDEAYEVLRVPPKHEYAKFVPHKEDNIEGLKKGQEIEVTPTDSGKSGPQRGSLISLNLEQVCLRNEKDLVMHFPRLGFSIKKV